MPYLQCPTCRLSTFSVAGYSSRDHCPRCGTELAAQARGRRFAPRPVTGTHVRPPAPAHQPEAP
jgi:hypothetical protein